MNDPVASIAGLAQQELTASVQALALPKGLYVFSVKSADPERVAELGGLMLPAMHIGVGPNVPARAIEFLFAGDEGSPWLYAPGDTLVAKVVDAQVMLFLTSVRRAGAEPLDVEVERLDARHEPEAPAAAVPPRAASASASAARREEPVRLQISAHISNRGDVVFIDTEWVGRLGHGMSIEAFSVTPLDQLAVADIEYKGLTGAGFESPWISNGELCGTRGMGIPLVGFAVRLKPQAAAMGYACAYRGYFRSGAISEPAKNGELCRSPTPGDPLEGIELRITHG
jgi:Clostridial hydrophobic W